MPTLLVIRGLPASGKSTLARQAIAREPGRWVVVEWDHLCAMLHPVPGGQPDEVVACTDIALHALVRVLLATGRDVISPDLNLDPDRLADLLAAARSVPEVEVRYADLTGVGLETCLARNSTRPPAGEPYRPGQRVSGERIARLYEDHIAPVAPRSTTACG